LSLQLQERLATDDRDHRIVDLDDAEAADRLAGHLREVIQQALAALPAKDRSGRQLALVNELLAWLRQRDEATDAELAVCDPPRVLRLISDPLLPGQTPPALPDVPLLDHDLLTNAPGEPSLGHALRTELETADRVDAVIAFIRWTGLRFLFPAFERLRRDNRRVRLLTTTYIGATERRALDWLVANGVELKISYETRTTRLHAKSWLIHRDSGYSTAFVGSSNLSRAALVDGLEWNVRLAEKSAPAVLSKLRATFESLWNDDSFEAYDPARDAERFDRVVQASRGGPSMTILAGLEVRPWPYQREILEALVAERERFERFRNLVVAPTGTGKTVVAALDYRALREGDGGVSVGRDATLLFVAHRQQILEQSLRTFRDVLGRGDFGEMLVGGQRPGQWRHVFASIQSLHQLGPEGLPPEHFDVVYIDEFHHAEAATYRALLARLKPKVLVGLTATPERSDGSNVRELFDGRYAFEMRLWDALDQQLLAPFHYFGVADGTDLSALNWQRGGYRISDLEAAYVVHDGFDARSAKILTALHERVADPLQMRAFGFCVSVAHAHYMAARFNRAGIPAVAMDASNDAESRNTMLDQLRRRELNVVFAVDVLSEGIDVPEVDTILLLRPTESATVFLQQLGRGLRLHRSKDVCSVLDFIGQQHRRFRIDLRLRGLTGRSRGELLRDTEQGFPWLPSGCQIQLDRQAQAHIIENLKAVTSSGANALAAELRELQSRLGPITLARFLEETLREPDDVYRSKLGWTALRRAAGAVLEAPGPRETEIGKAIGLRLQQIDDPERLATLRKIARAEPLAADARSQALATMLGFILFDDGKAPDSILAIQAALQSEPAVREELLELAEVLEDRARLLTRPSTLWPDVPLHVHARYSRSEVLVALGDRRLGQATSMREGVKFLEQRNADLLFVTLNKSERHYSPTTRYRDYAISRELFHWESQSTTTRHSATGQRYLQDRSCVLLFVRETPKDSRGRAPAFIFLGRARRIADQGERPIQITWRLDTPMPEAIFRQARAVA
jgi:superfamily II DNA or RNA helicase/HKD family nuclease